MTDPLWEAAVGAASLSAQRRRLVERLGAAGIEPAVVEGLARFTEPGALLLPDDRGTSWAGAGEELLVPVGWTWPEGEYGPLALLADIDLGGVVGVEQLGLFASSGRPLFFHDETPGLIEPWLGSCHVVFVPSGAECVRVPVRGEFRPTGRAPLLGAVTPLVGIDDEALAMLRERGTSETYEPLWNATLYQASGWRLLGGMEFETPLFDVIRFWFLDENSSEDCERFSAAEREGVGWRALLQLCAIGAPRYGFHIEWGAGSRLTYCLPEVDLAAGRFDRVIATFGP